MLLLIRRFTRRAGWAWPLLVNVLILAIEYSLYAWGHSVVILFAAQLLRGFSFALYIASRYQYIHRLAPEGMEASTQALINSISAVVNVIAAAAGGFLLESLGTRSFFALLVGLQLISGVFLWVSILPVQNGSIRCPETGNACCLSRNQRGGNKQRQGHAGFPENGFHSIIGSR